jgi:serine/threonine protein kinase
VNFTTISKAIFGVAATMCQLHDRHVLHRDLKPGNVLLNERGEPLLTGFDLSRFYSQSDQMTEGHVGSPVFMAPEIFATDLVAYSEKIDVYSFGLFLYSIFTDSYTLTSGPVRSSQRLMMEVARGHRYVRPARMPDAFWQLICECWDSAPDRRPSFAEITKRMMDSDDFTIEGTDLSEYHEYRNRLMRESSNVPVIDWSRIEAQLRSLGIDIDSITGLHA